MIHKKNDHESIGEGSMRSRKTIENTLIEIQKNIANIREKTDKEKELLAEKERSEETSSNLFSLIKYMVDENKRTTMLLKSISENMARLESGIRDNSYYEEEEVEDQRQNVVRGAREIPVSWLDAEILKNIQVLGMACADDIKKSMNYKGRNAASMRLNRLYRLGVLDRYQLGRKVYYKYDAGKAADALIVSPPQ
jgi:hypothetical protein